MLADFIRGMRDSTPEENKSVIDYISNISEPTGVYIYPQVDGITPTVIANDQIKQQSCEDVVNKILQRMWNWRGKNTISIDKVAMEQIIREELSVTLRQPEFYPPCKDCHKKMDEIRKAYDKISERQMLQKPLKCRNANCAAMCDPVFAEMWSREPKKCPRYKKVICEKSS